MPTVPLLRSAAAFAFALGAVVGCQKNEFIPPPAPAVTVENPRREPVTTYLDVTGRMDAVESVEIRARVKGFLNSVDFKPSTIVEAGDVLFTIEPDTFQAQVALKEGLLAQAQATATLAEATLQKAQRAADRGAVTELELMEVTAERDAAQAAVKSAQAELDTAKLELSYTTILAPVRGRVSREFVTIGNLVGSGEATLLTTIVVDDSIYVYFDLNERLVLEQLRKHGRGSSEGTLEVDLQFADGSDYDHTGLVDFADNRVDTTTGTIRVRAIFPNPNGLLVPGMFGRVRFPSTLDDAVLIPELALQRDIVGHFCLLVDDQNVVQRRDVELGPLIERKHRVIVSGLDGSERVIVNGLQRARPGIEVAAETATPSPSPAPSAVPPADDAAAANDGRS